MTSPDTAGDEGLLLLREPWARRDTVGAVAGLLTLTMGAVFTRKPSDSTRRERGNRFRRSSFPVSAVLFGLSPHTEMPMDTPAFLAPALPPRVAMLLQDPSRLPPADAPSAPGGAGSAWWPLAPAGPAQALLRALQHAAQPLGHTVPTTLCVQAGPPAASARKFTVSAFCYPFATVNF